MSGNWSWPGRACASCDARAGWPLWGGAEGCERSGGSLAVGGWKVRLPLYAAGLATGGAFCILFTGGALLYLLGAALVALVVGSAGAYRFLLLFPAAALYTLVAVYGRPPLSLSGWRRLF